MIQTAFFDHIQPFSQGIHIYRRNGKPWRKMRFTVLRNSHSMKFLFNTLSSRIIFRSYEYFGRSSWKQEMNLHFIECLYKMGPLWFNWRINKGTKANTKISSAVLHDISSKILISFWKMLKGIVLFIAFQAFKIIISIP